jgi:lipoyl(octanoyl) transferase
VRPWRVLDLGTAPFREVWARQLALVEARQRDDAPDTLIIVELPHVFTLGRRRGADANVLGPGDVEVVEIERGGDVTYHGPGQIVAYPIVALDEADGERDLHAYLRRLEAAMIGACASAGVVAEREPGKTGVWTGASDRRRKLGSIGIACRRWVTFHGLALNVTTDLAYFQRINPCGFDPDVMTSLAREAGGDVGTATVRDALVAELERQLGRYST